jgi:hypothetical protein
MQEVGGRMVAADVSAPLTINFELEWITYFQPVIFNLDIMHKKIARLLMGSKNPRDQGPVGDSPQPARITNLTASLGIKRRLIKYYLTAFARL